MRTATIAVRVLAWIIAAVLMMPIIASAQDAGDTDAPVKFSKEELTQMLAPIALYPDSLTAQILMAATYPLEVVEAERWLRQNSSLKGDDLDNALQTKPWDPSVAALCHFPTILYAMSSKLDQTRKLGDAFLAQQQDVMVTIQELRRKAEAAGTLKTTSQEKVVVENNTIQIQPVDPNVIYVPVYDPLYVYGPWWYPAYPPYYWYYPPGFVTGAVIGFGPGIYVGFDLFSWVWFDWPFFRIDLDYDRAGRFHRHHRHDPDDHFWRHNPYHRRGVAYRDRKTSELFGTRPPRSAPHSSETRGFPGQRFEKSSQPTARKPQENRDMPMKRSRTVAPQSAPRDTPFRGVGEGSFERRAGERGASSIRSSETRPSGGEYRGGGSRPQGSGSSYREGNRDGSSGGSYGGGGRSQGGGFGGGNRGDGPRR